MISTTPNSELNQKSGISMELNDWDDNIFTLLSLTYHGTKVKEAWHLSKGTTWRTKYYAIFFSYLKSYLFSVRCETHSHRGHKYAEVSLETEGGIETAIELFALTETSLLQFFIQSLYKARWAGSRHCLSSWKKCTGIKLQFYEMM